jgi:hypothetical protein
MLTKGTFFLALLLLGGSDAFAPQSKSSSLSQSPSAPLSSAVVDSSSPTTSSNWFAPDTSKKDEPSTLTTDQLKAQVLQLGAALDRGQAYNPTSGAYYSGVMLAAKKKIQELVSRADPEVNIPKSLEDIQGEWELVLTTVPHGIFRSSPFFLAIQEAFEYAEDGSECFLFVFLLSQSHTFTCAFSAFTFLFQHACLIFTILFYSVQRHSENQRQTYSSNSTNFKHAAGEHPK